MALTTKLKELILQGKYDDTFAKLYGKSEGMCEKQRQRYIQTIASFEEIFGADRDICIYSAPGRTEIGGNHTDHNNGMVMAAAVNLDIIAVVAKNNDNTSRVKSKGFDKVDVVDMGDLVPKAQEENSSVALLRGVAAGIVQRGGKVGGFDAYTTSDVLRGSGLSSSAAFEVVLGAIINGEFNDFKFDAVEIAKISQYAENVFFAKPSGLMDQTASSVGSAITIDFKDPSAPVVNKVAFELEKYGFALCITDTKGSHAGLTDEYAAVRGEMEQVAGFFGKKVLREVDENELISNMAKVREVTGDRAVLRALHFFADTKRAEALSNAIKNDNFNEFLSLIIEGGHSSFEYNQNAYCIKKPTEQGVSVGVALSQKILQGSGAWRLQGGGFAGTIQAFVPNALLKKYVDTMDAVFGDGSCYVLSVRNYGGVKVEENI